MELKKIFGTVLTVVGAAGLIYTAYLFLNENKGIETLLVYGVLGLILFFSGIGLIKKL